jgi:hypothetical protein
MKRNLGETDKVIRIILSIIIGGIGIYFQSWWGLLAFIPLITAFINFCPLYSIFGVSTYRHRTNVK